MIYRPRKPQPTLHKPVGPEVDSLGAAVEACWNHMQSSVPRPCGACYSIEGRDPDSNRLVLIDVRFEDGKVAWEGTVDDLMAEDDEEPAP